MVVMECNLEVITYGIPEYATIDDVPLQYQRHTVRVSTRMHRLLGQFIRVILCYHEHHTGKYPF